jgi:hypothetical protein
MSDECKHEPEPIRLADDEILSGGIIVDCATLPRAGASRYTYCAHCRTPLRVERDMRPRMTIWGWREMMGFDPYGDEMPVPDGPMPIEQARQRRSA